EAGRRRAHTRRPLEPGPLTSMPDTYRKNARQAEEWARQATRSAEREAYEQIAALWRKLAEREEKAGR
ncbi:MAG TPA: hypothetical protein VF699_11140, partial [Caulobacteraceae bacterium]